MVNTSGQQKIFSFASAYYLNYVFVRKLGSPGRNKHFNANNPDFYCVPHWHAAFNAL
jgi:hypothetical protein